MINFRVVEKTMDTAVFVGRDAGDGGGFCETVESFKTSFWLSIAFFALVADVA